MPPIQKSFMSSLFTLLFSLFTHLFANQVSDSADECIVVEAIFG